MKTFEVLSNACDFEQADKGTMVKEREVADQLQAAATGQRKEP